MTSVFTYITELSLDSSMNCYGFALNDLDLEVSVFVLVLVTALTAIVSVLVHVGHKVATQKEHKLTN